MSLASIAEWEMYITTQAPPPSPKWPMLCRVGRLTLVYHTIPLYKSQEKQGRSGPEWQAILDFNAARDDGSANQNSNTPLKFHSHHYHQKTNTRFFTDPMSFLLLSQQCPSTERSIVEINRFMCSACYVMFH